MTNLELVQSQLDAYNRGHIEDFCRCYHEDVEVRDFLSNKLLFQTMAEFRPIYETLFKANPGQRCELKARIVKAETIIDEEIITGRASSPDPIHAVAIYAFSEGLIDRIWFVK